MASEPLTLTDLFGDMKPSAIVEDIYGDGTELLIGHLDVAEINARTRDQEWWRPCLAVDELTIDHTWVTFDVHSPYCDAPDPANPGSDCDCSWEPWIVYHWRDATPTTPGAVAVTFVRVDQAAPAMQYREGAAA
ncbi:hypothetical protein ABN028_16000 [Actinopolymorpha sp. B17G11]|uniref:hypothetical protein n=1 Tax=Actinopolymorpha sp. B17G11 TaxID=3160861 RepID=UPI0032E45285